MDEAFILLKIIVNILPIISISYLILSIINFKSKLTNKVNYFAILLLVLSIYTFGYFLELNFKDENLALFVRNFQFMSFSMLPPLIVFFSIELTKKYKVNYKLKL